MERLHNLHLPYPVRWRITPSQVISSIFCSILLCSSAVALELTIHLNEKKNLPLDGTIVELVGHDLVSAPQNDHVINQINKDFDPPISIVPKGSTILLLNEDSFKHHIYSLSEGNQFDIPLFSRPSQKEVLVNNHGIVKMGCNIHDWMISYIYVNESDLVKEVSKSPVTFSGLSAGEYQVRVWNPRFRNTKRIIRYDLTLVDGQPHELTLDLTLRKSVQKKTKPTTSAYP
ncbi:MAG: hypothetical protein HOJ50_04620 [Proteobacteria bacterium]|jgi:hypothetical protein|nr:hypothetical protein [Pseudomonadota bacterium]MBT6348420.1 hypothetical protein [Pseudomonadota bacterium]